jgi:subtilisin family serine protease
MEFNKLPFFIFLFCMGVGEAWSQDRYAIHYRYKSTESFSLDDPIKFLTPDAIQRRVRESVPVDSTDLPVSEKYIAQITPHVQKFLFHSNWLNASVAKIDNQGIDMIRALPFVENVILVGRGQGPRLEDSRKSYNEPLKIKGLNKRQQTFEFQNDILGIPHMHEDGFTGKGVKIAVFDAGFVNSDKISGMQHLFDRNQIIATRDFVLPGSIDVYRSDSHGTGALSLLAAYDPDRMISGAFDASYILCITEDVDSEFWIEEYNWVKAAEFADSLGVDIINSSLGYNLFDDVDMNYTREDMDGNTATITKGASMAAKKGILVVTSNGNEGNLFWRTVTAPADAPDILAIGAISNSLEKAGFSSVGPTADGRIKPELVAFGTGVTLWRYSTGPSFSSGTSFSAPQIAALAAGLREAHPEWTRAQLKEKLIQSGHQFSNPDMNLGYGIPNYSRVMYGVVNSLESSEIAEKQSRIFPNPVDGNSLFVAYSKPHSCKLTLFTASGQLVDQWQLAENATGKPVEVSLASVVPGLYFVELQDGKAGELFKFWRR